MHHSVALPTAVHETAVAHLLRRDGQEDLCFALWYPSQGTQRTSALVQRLLLPEPGERRVHRNASFEPHYFERALQAAANANAGLAFLHSHPDSVGWQGMSDDDVDAELGHAPPVFGATELPLVGLTLSGEGSWSGRFWERSGNRRYERRWCRSVRVAGDRLAVTFHDRQAPAPAFRPELTRTVSAWGPKAQADLMRLVVGVIGTGSVGSLVAEALVRMGVARIRLLDFDRVEEKNLDRLLHASRPDALQHRPKVEVLAEALRQSATAGDFQVEPLRWSIVEEEGFRAALDCDVLFSCVDRPWPRGALNFAAYAHLIPVVDGGIAVETLRGNRGLRGADWRAHVAAPGRCCLECLGQYDPDLVGLERDGYLDDPQYIAGLGDESPLRRNENVFAFSMAVASLEVLQFLSMVVAPAGLANPGAQMHHFVTGKLETDDRTCAPDCLYRGLTAKGDRAGLSPTGQHRTAEEARQETVPATRGRLARMWERLRGLLFR